MIAATDRDCQFRGSPYALPMLGRRYRGSDFISRLWWVILCPRLRQRISGDRCLREDPLHQCDRTTVWTSGLMRPGCVPGDTVVSI